MAANKIGEGVHQTYREEAAKGFDVLFRVKIKGRSMLTEDIPLHMSLKIFQKRGEFDIDDIAKFVKEHGIVSPDPKKLTFKPIIFNSERTKEDFYMLEIEGLGEQYKALYDEYDDVGNVYKRFFTHVTIDKALYDDIKENGIKPEEIEFGNLILEAGAKNTIHDFGKSEDLEKDQPAITFPKVNGTSTRPDQEVQPAYTRQQKDIYRRKVVSAHNPNKPGVDPEDSQATRDAHVYRLETENFRNPFKGAAMPTPHGPKSTVRLDYLDTDPHDFKPDEDAHPDSKKRFVQNVAGAGKTVEAAKHHEGFHHVMWQIENKHGPEVRNHIVQTLLREHDPIALSYAKHHTQALGYDPKSRFFDEEVLNNIRDILVDPEKRRSFTDQVAKQRDEHTAKTHLNSLKAGHKKAYAKAKNLNIEDVLSQVGTGSKLAASEEMDKGIKNVAASIAVAGMMAAPQQSEAPVAPHVAHHEASHYDSGKMLRTIASVETQSGLNTAHSPVGGMHGGEAAIGKYGLMPHTIRETIHMHRDLKQKHGRALNLKGDDMRRYVEDNPGLEDVIAQRHLQRLEHHFGQDPAKLGHAWLQGIRGTYRAMKENKDIGSHWHVKKIKDAYAKQK